MKINHYISKSFILKTGLLDLSEDQLKRNIKKIAKIESDLHDKLNREVEEGIIEKYEKKYIIPTAKLMRNENGVNEWHVNYFKIQNIGRKRKHKNNSISKIKAKIESGKRKITHYSLIPPPNANYTTEISLNFKENYHAAYYEEVAKELYIRYQKNLYFVTERDKEGFVHLHIGCEGNKKEIMILMNHIVENVLGHFDDSYIKILEDGNFESNLHIDDIRSNDAYKKYLTKGDDGLGGAQIKFLNV